MREIKFRGQRLDNREWVYGGYYGDEKRAWIVVVTPTEYGRSILKYEVDPSTVEQYTGLKDKNGKEIWEGDIVDCWSEGVNAQGEVQQRKDGLWIIYPAWQKRVMWGLCPDKYSNTTVEVIGNIHEAKEATNE